jgi:phosphoglycolate phosphatase
VTPEKICSTIGLSLPATLAELAGPQYAGLSDGFVRFFIQRADEVMVNRTIVLEGVPETLRIIKGQGFSTGIVSTKFRRRIESILDRENLLKWVDIIVGSEDVNVHKPDPEGLLTAVKHLGNRLEDCLYVGDSVVDAQTASRAGVKFVAVLSGVTPLEHFSPYPVDCILQKLTELPSFLLELNCRNNQGVSSC